MYFHNDYHYGDCLFSVHALNRIVLCNDIICEFYCEPEYQDQLIELVCENSNFHFSNKKNKDSINMAVAHVDILAKAHYKYRNEFRSRFMCNRYPDYNDYYKGQLIMTQIICEENNLICPFHDPKDMMFDEEVLEKNSLDLKFDYLIVNSYCAAMESISSRKNQDLIFLDIINKLIVEGKSFITTVKLFDYPCTRDYNLSLVKIGQLSKNCKNILGIPISPFLISLNKFSFNNYEKIIVLRRNLETFDFDDERVVTIHSPNLPLEAQ